MNRISVILAAAALLLAVPSMSQEYGELFESETASGMRAESPMLSSGDEEAVADYVRGCFRSSGLDVLDSPDDSNFGILSAQGDTLRCHNAIGFIQGYDRKLKDSYIVVGAPIRGNVSGLLALLSLARTLSANRVLLKRSVILAAFGAADVENAGSWYFINRSFASDASRVDAMIDLCLLGQESRGFYAYTASNADMNQFVLNLAGTLQPVHPKIITAEPAISDHRSFYAKEIPFIQFTTGPVPHLGTVSERLEYEGIERAVEYIYHYAVELACGATPAFTPMEVEKPEREADTVAWADCDWKPTFMNNADPSVFLQRWVYTYLKYPQYAVDNGIQGKVLVDFVIDEKGKVRDVKVLKGVHSSLDEEAVKVVEASPDWKPARVRGKKVKCEMSLYIEFRLKKR